MAEIETGGPAFPLADSGFDMIGTNHECANGMTLHDYFAAHAPTPPAWIVKQYFEDEQSHGDVAKAMAEWADTYADAMIARRSKE